MTDPGKIDRPVSQRTMESIEQLRADNEKLRKRLANAQDVITGLTELLNDAREEAALDRR